MGRGWIALQITAEVLWFSLDILQYIDYKKMGGEIVIREITENDYKVTGSKQENTLNFYRKAGYNSEDKTAFIQWI